MCGTHSRADLQDFSGYPFGRCPSDMPELLEDALVEFESAAHFARRKIERRSFVGDAISDLVRFPRRVDRIELRPIDPFHLVRYSLALIPLHIEKLVEHDVGFENGEAPAFGVRSVRLLQDAVPPQLRPRDVLTRHGAPHGLDGAALRATDLNDADPTVQHEREKRDRGGERNERKEIPALNEAAVRGRAGGLFEKTGHIPERDWLGEIRIRRSLIGSARNDDRDDGRNPSKK